MRSAIVLLLLVLANPVWAAESEIPRITAHPVIEVDVATDPDPAWQSADDRVHCSFASTDRAFERHRLPVLTQETSTWSGTAWKGERVNAQVVVWSRKPLLQLRAEATELSGPQGTIPATAVRVRFVRYVLSESPLDFKEADCEKTDQSKAYLVPDVLDPVGRFDVPASTTRPVWITIDVLRTTAPGKYSGTVRFKAEGGLDQNMTLNLEVVDGTVPSPADWSFRVDFWQNPWAVAEQHRVAPWSEAHLAILRDHLRTLADMGQTYVSAYITHSPWRDDTFVPDATMVEWIRQPDGSFKFDYRIFDTYVELAMSAGIDDAISCFTMIPWNGRIRYLDAATGEYVWATWQTGSPEYPRFWKAFLADLRQHLVERGWFRKTYLEVNERSLEDTLLAVKLARADSPDWKFTFAGNFHKELVEIIDDLCTLVDSQTPAEDLVSRRKRRQTTTFYVCCTPPLPNNFPFSPPAENVWMGWFAAAAGLDGFLRWAWDNWPANPMLDSRHVLFPAGDTFLVYPGSVASIRMERLREGFVDFEKLRIVRSRLSSDGNEKAREALLALDRALEKFSWDRVKSTQGSTVINDVQAARAALEAASRVAFSPR